MTNKKPEAAGALAGEGEVNRRLARDLLASAKDVEQYDMPGAARTMRQAAAALYAAPVGAQQPAVVEDGRVLHFLRRHGLKGLEELPGWGWSYGDTCEIEQMIENGTLLEHFDEWLDYKPSAALAPAATPVPVGGEDCDCAEDCKRGFDHPLHCSLAQQGPVVDEAMVERAYVVGAGRPISRLTARAMLDAALAHPPQDGRADG